MESKKKKIVMIVVITVLVLIIIGLIGFIVWDKTRQTNNSENNLETKSTTTPDVITTAEAPSPKATDNISKERELTITELNNIKEYLENNHKLLFLANEYKKPEDAKIYLQVMYEYDDSDLTRTVMTKQEMISALFDNNGREYDEEEINDTYNDIMLYKIASKDLDEYIKKNLGISLSNLKNIDLEYVSSLDAYWVMQPKDAFELNIEMVSGQINKEGLYVVEYTDNYNYHWIATLKKNEESYVFVSNVNTVNSKIEKIENNSSKYSKKTKKYSDYLECVMYYEDNNLYYAELVPSNSDDYSSIYYIYYFENNVCFACINYKGSPIEYYSDYEIASKQILNLFED